MRRSSYEVGFQRGLEAALDLMDARLRGLALGIVEGALQELEDAAVSAAAGGFAPGPN